MANIHSGAATTISGGDNGLITNFPATNTTHSLYTLPLSVLDTILLKLNLHQIKQTKILCRGFYNVLMHLGLPGIAYTNAQRQIEKESDVGKVFPTFDFLSDIKRNSIASDTRYTKGVEVEGITGIVIRSEKVEDGKHVIIKKFEVSSLDEEELSLEIKAYKSNCPYLERIIDSFIEDDFISLVFSPYLSLYDVLMMPTAPSVISTERITSYICHIVLRALNVLRNHQFDVSVCTIADLYIKRDRLVLAPVLSLLAVDSRYMYSAPEVLQKEGNSVTQGVWSTGVIAKNLLEQKNPGQEIIPPVEMVKSCFSICSRGLVLDTPQSFSKDCQSFVKACLTMDYNERPTEEVLLKHPFFGITL
mmetsp:Transcript_28935/g.32142  ORF Transcript_28935/g.32142 Transcript_28935/m.32142 type:complete len:361 (-) Transcript_28935:83-1165(-)